MKYPQDNCWLCSCWSVSASKCTVDFSHLDNVSVALLFPLKTDKSQSNHFRQLFQLLHTLGHSWADRLWEMVILHSCFLFKRMLNSPVSSGVGTCPLAWCGVWKPVVVRWCFWRTCWMKLELECCATWSNRKVHPKLSMYLTHVTNWRLACLCLFLIFICHQYSTFLFALTKQVFVSFTGLKLSLHSLKNLRLSVHIFGKCFDSKNELLGSVSNYCFFISHKENGKSRRNGRESGN